MIVDLGEWLPDQPDFRNQGATVAKNVIPSATGYRSFPSLTEYSNALDAYARGGALARDKDGNVYAYAGNETKLYSLGASITDVSKVGGYATTAENGWEFVKWNEQILATNFDDAIQVITLGGANFADLSGTPPKARHIGVVRDFVVTGNTNDTDGNVPNRVRWSGFNTNTDWTVGTNQADFEDLKGDGGWVQKVVGGEFGLIFQERAIYRMQYVGPPVVFSFDQIEGGYGTPAPGSVAQLGGNVFYLGQDGFYMLVNGAQSFPIGHEKVNRYFFQDVDDSYMYRISSAIDPENNIVVWAYPGSGSTGGEPNKMIIYNWITKSWSVVEQGVQLIIQSATFGLTLDQLDTINTSLDALPNSLDSRVWVGGSVQLAAITTGSKLAYFDGAALDAEVETKEFGNVSHKQLLSNVRPIVEGNGSTAIQVQVKSRDSLTAAETMSGAIPLDTDGKASTRSNARYHRVKLCVSGGFEHAVGADVQVTQLGRR